ncbi:MAG: TadE/TadG family type IV pilus assembly protein [Aeromicrobium sp.]
MTPGRSYHSTRGTRRRPRSRGQSLVEFAVVLPVFLLILSGIIDFGFLLYSRMTVINAAREGAHVVIAATDTPTVIEALVADRVTDVGGGLLTSGMVETVCVPKTAPCSFTTDGLEPGDSVKVTVTYPYRSLFPLLLGQTFDVSSTVQMVFE